MKNLTLVCTTLLFSALSINTASADENRYQAHWNGKSYLIVDSDDGHLWTFRNDSMIYNGQVDGSRFIPPEDSQIWQQKHGTWTKNN